MRALLAAATVFLILLAMASPAEASSPCRACIRRVVRAEAPALSRCYADLQKRAGRGRRGRVVARFTVRRDGTTAGVHLSRNDLRDRRFGRCVGRVFEGLRFQRTPDPMRIAYPLRFATE